MQSYHGYLLSFCLIFSSVATAIPDKVDWPAYGNDLGGTKYSPLDQINRDNVHRLKPVWTFHTGDISTQSPKTTFEATPLMVNDSLYVCTPYNRVIALDPGTGQAKWQYDPHIDKSFSIEGALKCRGLAYWEDKHVTPDTPKLCQKRIFTGTMDSRLIALDADTGALCADFGKQGQVDTTQYGKPDRRGMDFISPPAIYQDLVILGGSIGDNSFADMGDGSVRAFDARSGKLVWSFNPIPHFLTHKTGAANTWAPISIDEKRGWVFIGTSSPSPDYYGGFRTEDIPYANATIALNAKTGVPIWHFQTVHHDLWDYDIPAQPSLIEIQKDDGQMQSAVVQSTKTGFLFLFDRDTGQPLFPVEEKSVPKSDVPGEKASPTQPHPTLPLPYSRQSMTADDAWGMLGIDKWLCKKQIQKLRNEGMFTPPAMGDGSIEMPGFAGGSNWGGVAYDPIRRWIIINSMNIAARVKLVETPKNRSRHIDDDYGEFEPTQDGPYSMSRGILMSVFGAPCTPPPWGQLTAYDIVTGKMVWQVPFGRVKMGPFKTLRRWGAPNMGGPIVTKGGLIFIGATLDHEFHAYDIETAKELWTGHLPAPANATPMTYAWKGKQYIVVAAGGHGVFNTKLSDAVIAYALPD